MLATDPGESATAVPFALVKLTFVLEAIGTESATPMKATLLTKLTFVLVAIDPGVSAMMKIFLTILTFEPLAHVLATDPGENTTAVLFALAKLTFVNEAIATISATPMKETLTKLAFVFVAIGPGVSAMMHFSITI